MKYQTDIDTLKKDRSVKGMKFQTMSISRLKQEAPTFYKYLVEEAKCQPLKADTNLLVVYRKRYNNAANIAAKADNFESVNIALEEFGEGEAIILSNSDVSALDLKLADFKML